MSGTTERDCVFCDIVAGRAEVSPIHEDGTVVAFMDLHPVTPGHLLVVPRQHVAGLADLPDRIGARVWSVGRAMASALRRSSLAAEGINLLVCDGEVAMQTVLHLHLHVVPRTAGDGSVLGIGDGAEPQRRSVLDDQARAIRAALAVS